MHEFSVPTPTEKAEDSAESKPVKSGASAIAVASLGVALAAGNAYLFTKSNRLEGELGELRAAVKSEIIAIQNGAEAAQARNMQTVSELRQQLQETGAKSAQAVAQANISAKRYTEQLAHRIAATQQETKQFHNTLAAQLGEMQQDASKTKDQVKSVANDVTTVRTEVAQTKTDLDRTIGDLKSVRGDLGVQSGLIATNARELAALRARGERDYFEFQLTKSKAPQRIAADVALQLRRADPKRNRYTIHLVADDKKVEKKDRGVNEPVQFYMAKARTPYEIVINEVRADRIVGYLSAPKVKSAVLTSQIGRP